MADTPQPLPPLLPVIPEYKPWLDRMQKETAADAAAADAGFAARQGPLSGPDRPARVHPEQVRGALADASA